MKPPVPVLILALIVPLLDARAQDTTRAGGGGPAAVAILAEVNGEPITLHDLEKELVLDEDWNTLLRQGARGVPLEMRKRDLRRAALDRLIEDILLVQAAKARKVKLTVEDQKKIDQAFTDYAKEKWGSVEALEEAFRAVGIETLRARWRNRFLVQKLLEEEAQKSDSFVRPEEIRSYYAAHKEEYREPGQVLFEYMEIPKDRDPEAAHATAEKALAELRAGKPFAEVAGEHARGARRLPVESVDALRKDLADAVRTLREGEVSGIIDREASFQILRLATNRAERYRSFDEVQDEIAARLRKQKFDQRLADLKVRLRRDATIRISPSPLIDAQAKP